MFLRISRGFHKSIKLLKLETFIIPQPGEGIAEVEIVQWLVAPNTKVAEFQVLCEARSDKGFIEYKSPFNGILKELCYKPADMAQIGSALYKIDVEGAANNAPQELKDGNEAPDSNDFKQGSPEDGQGKGSKADGEVKAQASEIFNALPNKVLATPATRNLARSRGVDLRLVTPTGADGRVTSADVETFVEGSNRPASLPSTILEDPTHIHPPPMPSVSSSSQDKIVKLTPVQRGMVKSMTEALKIPHLTYCEDVYMDQVISLRNQLKANLKNVKLTFMPFFIKALSLAILDFPLVNATFSESKSECVLKSSHNVSFAMDSAFGLIVPNIKDVQAKSIYEISQEMARITDLGAKGKLTDNDLKGGTIALSNIGAIGGTYTAPVILPPQVFIGALGATRPVLERVSGNIEEKMVLKTSWSADHRILDGATTARFVARWKALIENPSLMLLHLK